jgi:hypothetical protein
VNAHQTPMLLLELKSSPISSLSPVWIQTQVARFCAP